MSTKLLVIDDNPGITKVIAMVAARLGYITQTVNEPRHAIDVFLEFRPDVTMVDMVMPEHDGIDVLNDLLLSGIPTQLVLMSGFADAYLRLAAGVAQFHDASPVAVLHKPFRRVELAGLLERLACVTEDMPRH
jgi:CheY-like chemotaxis protein